MMVRAGGLSYIRSVSILTIVELGSGLRVAIVHARWNETIINALLSGAKKSLLAAGVTEDNITVQSVPGSYELPFAVQRSVSSLHLNNAH